MFGAKQGGVAAYAKVGLETGVLAASPHKLIVMLFDGALQALRNAREQMKAGDIPAKGKSIAREQHHHQRPARQPRPAKGWRNRRQPRRAVRLHVAPPDAGPPAQQCGRTR
jgi:hypothetical protein